jgi:TonB family protein
MSTKVKVGLLIVAAISMAACPLAAAAGGERATCATILRALVGTPEASETGPASVLVIPGPFVLLGRSPEQDARDVLQLMSQLKDTYRLGTVTLAGTSGAWLAAGEGSDVPVPVADIGARVTLLDFDATKAAYSVRLMKRGEESSVTTVVVIRGERGLIGARDGTEAPYLFLSLEPLKPYPKSEVNPPAVMPKLIRRVQPTYPPEARKAGIDGVVILEARIGTDGVVHDLKAFRSEPMWLTEAAIEAVKQWRYEPAKDASGKPVEAALNVTISFILDRSNSEKAKT